MINSNLHVQVAITPLSNFSLVDTVFAYYATECEFESRQNNTWVKIDLTWTNWLVLDELLYFLFFLMELQMYT